MNSHSSPPEMLGSIGMPASHLLAESLSAAGYPTTVAGKVYNWDRLVIETDLGDLTIFARPLQKPFTGPSLYPCEIGLPRGLDWFNLDESAEPDQIVYFPAGADAMKMLAQILGLLGPDRNSILNESAIRHMEALNGGFPSSALVMLKQGEDQHFERYFQLWQHQGNGACTWHPLTKSHNPFDAAREAAEVYGCHPTVYRCHSGIFIAFRQTIATPFL